MRHLECFSRFPPMFHQLLPRDSASYELEVGLPQDGCSPLSGCQLANRVQAGFGVL